MHTGKTKSCNFFPFFFSFSSFNLKDEGEETKIADTAPPKKNPAPIKASCHSSTMACMCTVLNQLVRLKNEIVCFAYSIHFKNCRRAVKSI